MAERRGPTQIENRNFLAPVGFKFNLQRSPGVAYFCNQANIPDISLGVANQANYLRDIPTPGDKMDFGDLSLRFLVDEDLKNYMEIQKWMRGLGFPESKSLISLRKRVTTDYLKGMPNLVIKSIQMEHYRY